MTLVVQVLIHNPREFAEVCRTFLKDVSVLALLGEQQGDRRGPGDRGQHRSVGPGHQIVSEAAGSGGGGLRCQDSWCAGRTQSTTEGLPRHGGDRRPRGGGQAIFGHFPKGNCSFVGMAFIIFLP